MIRNYWKIAITKYQTVNKKAANGCLFSDMLFIFLTYSDQGFFGGRTSPVSPPVPCSPSPIVWTVPFPWWLWFEWEGHSNPINIAKNTLYITQKFYLKNLVGPRGSTRGGCYNFFRRPSELLGSVRFGRGSYQLLPNRLTASAASSRFEICLVPLFVD